jgi:hypothetical protein
MKTEVYSWRISSGLKSDLERVARRHKVHISTILETAAREWLMKNAREIRDDDEQRALHAAVERCIGAFASGNPRGSETVRETVRKRLAQRYGR